MAWSQACRQRAPVFKAGDGKWGWSSCLDKMRRPASDSYSLIINIFDSLLSASLSALTA